MIYLSQSLNTNATAQVMRWRPPRLVRGMWCIQMTGIFIPLRAEFYFGNTNIGVPYIIPRRRDGAGNQDPIIWKRTAYLSYIVRVMAAADLTTQGVMESAAWDWPSFQHYSGCAIKRIFNNALTGSIKTHTTDSSWYITTNISTLLSTRSRSIQFYTKVWKWH